MKILCLQGQLPSYRVPIFSSLGAISDLTVVHGGERRRDSNLGFEQIIVPVHRRGPFAYYDRLLFDLCCRYDVILSESDIRYIDRDLMVLWPFRKFRWVGWGIGVSASYENKFDQNTRFDFARNFILKRADALAFYSSYPIKKYVANGFDPNALFVADNTVQIYYDATVSFQKRKLLFVGTLYKQKSIFSLLESYRAYAETSADPIELSIVGDGDEAASIRDWIDRHNLANRVLMHGSVFDPFILHQHFRESFACLSPGQAGLSVLSSMAHGVPFVTRRDAITGGEIFNILNGTNGVVYDADDELVPILRDIESNKSKYVAMGETAREYYLHERTPERMVNALFSACEYAMRKQF